MEKMEAKELSYMTDSYNTDNDGWWAMISTQNEF